ncbi:hypothetical protein GGI42DRAFT_360255 [Trichoderma sp. SZMC 28013]
MAFLLQKISGNFFGHNATLNQGNINITVNKASSDDKKKFLKSISKINPADEKLRIQKAKGHFLRESFSWVLDHENFNRWCTAESGVFWIKGDPGKGKTMLMCGIIDEFEKDAAISSNLSYFFCQATDSRINTATSVIGSLLIPLLRRHQVLLSEIQNKYEDRLEGPNAWFILCEIFETVIQHPQFANTVFVIDAIDECIEDCDNLLRFIIQTNGVKWLLSSRNEKDIEQELRSIQPSQILSLEDNSQYTSNAIEIYINNRIQDILALEGNEELRIKTLKILNDKAMGTYLWVAIVVEQLRKTDHMGVEDALAEMPQGLENLYSMILKQANDRLNPKRMDACEILLSIVTTAERPLHLKELSTFMSFQCHSFNRNFGLQDMKSITQDCGSILSIRDNVVYFIHQSARDFIIRTKFSSGLHDQHLQMFQTSLHAMSENLKYNMSSKAPWAHIMDIQPQDFNIITSIEYCCLFWSQHLLSGYSSGTADEIRKTNTTLYTFLKRSFLCWIESMSLMHRLPQALNIVQKLKDLIESHCRNDPNENYTSQLLSQEEEALGLRQFIHDAYQFLLRSMDTVESWPLQLYFSAMSLEQANSIIRHTFEDSVRDYWRPFPSLITVSQSPPSLLLHSIFVEPTGSREILFSSVFFSPDSSLICLLYSGDLAVYRVDTASFLCRFSMGNGGRAAFDLDSDRITTLTADGTVQLWSLKDVICINRSYLSYGNDENFTAIIALSRNGDWIATFNRRITSTDVNLNSEMSDVRIWRTGTVICNFPWDRADEPESAFSPDSRLLALADRKGIRIHFSTTGHLIRYLDSNRLDEPAHMHTSRPLERRPIFSPDSKYLIAMESNASLCVWNTENGEVLFQIQEFPCSTPIYDFTVSPDSALLGVCSDHGTKLWSLETGKCVAKIAGVSYSMTFSADWAKSRLVALQSACSILEIRRVNAYQDNEEDSDYGFTQVVISPNSKFVAARNTKHSEVSVWSGDTGQQVCVLKGDFCNCRGSIPVFSPDSELLAYGINDIFIWHVATGENRHVLRYPSGKGPIKRIAFSIDSTYLVAGGRFITMWCMNPCKYVYEYEISDTNKRLSSIAISADATHVAYLCRDDSGWEIKIWKLETSNTMLERNAVSTTRVWGDYRIGATSKIAFSSDSTVLMLISQDFLKIFEVTTGDRLQYLDLQPSRHPAFFDPFTDRIFTSYDVFSKVAWNEWERNPRSCYSYVHGEAYEEDRTKSAWIVHGGEKITYLPMDFRPDINPLREKSWDISDSLFAFINESEALFIIKFPF